MKPRTKLQRQVIEDSRYLLNLESKMLTWAKADCLGHKGFATKNRVFCMDCGGTFSADLVKRKRAVCPHCHTKLKIEYSRKTIDKQQMYIAFAQVYESLVQFNGADLSGEMPE